MVIVSRRRRRIAWLLFCRAEDLANAWSFYRGHREQIERQIQEKKAA
jgi:hypothetical protein